jgi:hypothetical protein
LAAVIERTTRIRNAYEKEKRHLNGQVCCLVPATFHGDGMQPVSWKWPWSHWLGTAAYHCRPTGGESPPNSHSVPVYMLA